MSEVNDLNINRFLQQVVTGVTGMDPQLVRPRWQPEPPNQPDFGTDWAAIGEISRTREPFAAVLHFTPLYPELPYDAVIRNQILEILCSFYGPNCEANNELFAMGLSLAQNREVLFLNGFGLVEVMESVNVPALIKGRWMSGWDTRFRIRRQQVYQYPVGNLIEADLTLVTDVPASTTKIVAKQ
jgi:hypothetical protein